MSMNSLKRSAKKLTIILTVLFIVGIFIFLTTRPKPDPCFNKVQDNGEAGVDCGGFCAKTCPVQGKPDEAYDITINWVKFVQDGRNNYDFVANLSNENQKWGVAEAAYKFTYFDDKGNEIGKREGRTSISPKGNAMDLSSKYIIENDIESETPPSKVTLSLNDLRWEQIKNDLDVDNLNENIVKIAQPNFRFDKTRGTYIASGVTQNDSKYDFYRVDINVVIFRKDGEIMAAGKTDQLTLESKDGWEFTVVWPNLKVDQSEFGRMDCKAETNVFDKTNFLEEYRASSNS